MPSRIAFTWPVNSLTETGLGGAVLKDHAFKQRVVGMSGDYRERFGVVNESLRSVQVLRLLAATPRGLHGDDPSISRPMSR